LAEEISFHALRNDGFSSDALHSGNGYRKTVDRRTVEMSTPALGGAFGSAEDAVGLIDDVLESSTEYSMIATDMDGVIVLWNEGARRLYGYEPAEILGKPQSGLYAAKDVQAGLPQAMMEIARRQGKWRGTIQRVRRDAAASWQGW
jgi:PAS domain-containing protein